MKQDELKELQFSQVLGLTTSLKKLAIMMLINAIEEDTAQNIISALETEEEAKEFKKINS